MTEPKKGIVVVGFLRSGTTLLRRMLDCHPQIACPGETCILSACARFLQSDVVGDGLEFGVLNGLAFAGTQPEETLEKLRNFAFSFPQDFARSSGKPRWAEKTAIDIFHIEEIEQFCGDQVQYVCVVRHGLDVACSVRDFSERGFSYLTEIHEYVQKYPRPLEAFSHAWVETNSMLRAFIERQGENALLIRYEDLVDDPLSESTRLFDFLGEEWAEEYLDAAGAQTGSLGFGDWKAHEKTEVDRKSVGRWKSLPPSVQAQMAEICNPVLKAFGYDPVPVRRRSSQSSARRRYELGLQLGKGKPSTKS